MKFIFAETVDDVINAALEKPKPQKKPKTTSVKEKTKPTKAKKNVKGKSTARGR